MSRHQDCERTLATPDVGDGADVERCPPFFEQLGSGYKIKMNLPRISYR